MECTEHLTKITEIKCTAILAYISLNISNYSYIGIEWVELHVLPDPELLGQGPSRIP